ncbi:MAG TPA: DUF1080 domain-containing protein [Candidatus Brocadiia bacterium]|nr:DUF1080 domain-containing protein [Candidatus Brocadiia bacterium]
MRNTIIALAFACVILIGCDNTGRRQDQQVPEAAAPVVQVPEIPKPPAEEPLSAQDAAAIAVLKSAAPREEKMKACRELAQQGGRGVIPALEALLVDEELSHMARYGLEPLPYPEAGEALRNALPKTGGSLKVGVINSLAVRGDALAVPALIELLSSEDAAVAQESARALGVIATPEAGAALKAALGKADAASPLGEALCDGLLRCAEAMQRKGRKDQAAAVYDSVLAVPSAGPATRAAALRGAVLSRGGDEGLKTLADALRKDDNDVFDACLRVAVELGSEEKVTAVLAAGLSGMTAEKKVRLIKVLGLRGGEAAGAAMLTEAGSGDVAVRDAAIKSLTRMGYKPALKLMAELARTEGDLAKTAQDSLCYFPGEGGQAAIAAMLEDKDAKSRLVAIEMVGKGGLAQPTALLMKTVETDVSEEVRIAALEALYHRAGKPEMARLLDFIAAARSAAEINAAEKTLGALCAREKKMAPGNVVIVKAVYGALPDGPSADVTAKVAQIIKSGAFSIDASNANFGDTAPSIVKQLRVDYTENGVAQSKTVPENQTLKLTSATAPPEIVDAFVSAYTKARGAEAPAAPALLRLLATTESRKALEVVQGVAAQSEGEAKTAALRIMCDWPTADALPAVMDMAQNSTDPTLKMLAFRGTVRMLKLEAKGGSGSAAQYGALMKHADRADQKRLLLSGLAEIRQVEALEMVFAMFGDPEVKAEAVKAAATIAQNLGGDAREDASIIDCKDLTKWHATTNYWRIEDGAVVGQSDKDIPDTAYIWPNVEVADFYMSVLVKLEPPTANSGIQFRSKKLDEAAHALGYQGDIGKDVWGRLYHQGGRGKLDWNGRAEEAVKPGDWNRYEILAVGPAIWTAINGKLGVACLDTGAKDERSGGVAFQIHVGPPQTVRFKIEKLIHNPKVELAGLKAAELIGELKAP